MWLLMPRPCSDPGCDLRSLLRSGQLELGEPVAQILDRRYGQCPAEFIEDDRIGKNSELVPVDAHNVRGLWHAEVSAVSAAQGVVVAALQRPFVAPEHRTAVALQV